MASMAQARLGSPMSWRYVEGQHLYLEECLPLEVATVVVDNNNLSEPGIVRWKAGA